MRTDKNRDRDENEKTAPNDRDDDKNRDDSNDLAKKDKPNLKIDTKPSTGHEGLDAEKE